MKNAMIILTLAAGSTLAMGETIDARYTGIAGGSGASHLRVGGSTYYAGHMKHEITSGARSGERFSSFCIDLGEYALPGSATYQIVDLKDAPAPGVPYGEVIAGRISAIVANAARLGWIDNRLQADTNQAGYLGKMGAIQAAIWEAMGGDVRLSDSRTSSSLSSYYATLMNQATFDSDARLGGLKAMINEGRQDMLYVVPVPPAAMAGAGLLLGLGGVRVARRRK